MSKSAGITISKVSYTPEAYAYADFLRKRGYRVQLAVADQLAPDLDVHIYFMGLVPFWKRKGSWREIHEYQSLSTPSFPRTKDYIKKMINRKPDGRIFLNEIVSDKLRFKDSAPYIFRDMGVDDELFQQPSENPYYDIVYCGSVNGRLGLVEEILRLSNIGFKILVVGDVNEDVRRLFSHPGHRVEFAGRVKREHLPGLYRQCRLGLNYTPDIYPFNIQTSTKTLEYLASGLGVISNRYAWSDCFFKTHDGLIGWLDAVDNIGVLEFSKTISLDSSIYSWSNKLELIGFEQFVFGADLD